MLLNAAECLGYSFYLFRGIKGKPTEGWGGSKITPLTQIRVKRILISRSRLFKIYLEIISTQENNLLSSSNLHISNFSINKKISLIKILKSRGSRKDLWGIPLVTFAHYKIRSLYEEPIFFLCFRKRK